MNYENLPKDPVMLLSFINTMLRDQYKTLDDLCDAFHVKKESIVNTLSVIDYIYDASLNQFI